MLAVGPMSGLMPALMFHMLQLASTFVESLLHKSTLIINACPIYCTAACNHPNNVLDALINYRLST